MVLAPKISLLEVKQMAQNGLKMAQNGPNFFLDVVWSNIPTGHLRPKTTKITTLAKPVRYYYELLVMTNHVVMIVQSLVRAIGFMCFY